MDKNQQSDKLKAPHTTGWQAPLVDIVAAVLKRKWILILSVVVAVGLGGGAIPTDANDLPIVIGGAADVSGEAGLRCLR